MAFHNLTVMGLSWGVRFARTREYIKVGGSSQGQSVDLPHRISLVLILHELSY